MIRLFYLYQFNPLSQEIIGGGLIIGLMTGATMLSMTLDISWEVVAAMGTAKMAKNGKSKSQSSASRHDFLLPLSPVI